MKKYLVFSLVVLALCLWINSWGSLGEFGDGTGSKDSVWMNVSTFDTLGFEANADSVWFHRFYRTTIIDSTVLTSATRTGYYITGRRAFDGTNYGEYTVKIRWKIQGKYFGNEESYTVVDYLDSADVVRWVWQGNPRTLTNFNWALITNDSAYNYFINTQIALTSNYLTKADSGSTGASYLRAKYLEDKTGMALTSAYFTKADSGSTGASYLRIKYVEDKTGYALSSAGQSVLAITIADSLEERYTLSELMSIVYAIPGDSGCTQTFYRPTATSAPDSVRGVCGVTLRSRSIYKYNGSGKLDTAYVYIYK